VGAQQRRRIAKGTPVPTSGLRMGHSAHGLLWLRPQRRAGGSRSFRRTVRGQVSHLDWDMAQASTQDASTVPAHCGGGRAQSADRAYVRPGSRTLSAAPGGPHTHTARRRPPLRDPAQRQAGPPQQRAPPGRQAGALVPE
jgi:hypothetical protein